MSGAKVLSTAVASELIYTWLPRDDAGWKAKPPVIFFHGFEGGSYNVSAYTDYVRQPNTDVLTDLAVRSGFGLFLPEMGGDLWGNDTALTRFDSVMTYVGTLGGRTDVAILYAISGGAANAWRIACDRASKVRCVLGIMPACDIEAIRTADPNMGTPTGVRTSINTAAETTGTAPANPLPANMVPLTRAAIVGTKARLYYGSADAIVLPSTVTAMAAQIGSSCTTSLVDTTNAHGDAIVGSVPQHDFHDYLLANAA